MKPATRSAHPVLATLSLGTLLAGDLWRNLLSWGGFLVVVAALTAILAVILTREGAWRMLTLRRLPKPLALLGLLMVLSVTWSAYPGATVLGLLAQAATSVAAVFFATSLSWPQIVTALGRATRWILGLSLAFELIIAVFVRQPILPLWVDYGRGKLPDAFYWSQSALFTGEPIQGIVGNRNLLAFIAVIALISIGIEFASRSLRPARSIAWLAVAVITLGLTRSTTAIAVLVIVAMVWGILSFARRVSAGRQGAVLAGGIVLALAAAGSVVALSGPLLKLFGKSPDLTGRLDIWNSVTTLATQRPVFGWGWVSYWAPWVEPFTHLAERKGVTYLQAHNAWLDVWFQLGFVGLALFIAAVVSAGWRTWWFAVDRPLDARGTTLPYSPVALFPALILTLLVAQSFVESRMLLEGGWALFALVTLKSKLDVGATVPVAPRAEMASVDAAAPPVLPPAGSAR